jgi:hypothetical protein
LFGWAPWARQWASLPARERRLGLAALYDSYPVLQSAEIHIEVGRHALGAVRRRGLNRRHPQLMRDSPADPADLPPPFKPSPGFRQAVHLRASPHRPSSSKVEVGTNAFFPDTPKDSCTLAETTRITARYDEATLGQPADGLSVKWAAIIIFSTARCACCRPSGIRRASICRWRKLA